MIKNLTKINRSVTIDSKKCISGLFITMKIFIRFTQIENMKMKVKKQQTLNTEKKFEKKLQ